MNHDDLKNKDYRDAFVDAMIRTGIAFQIKALRKKKPWSQKQLGGQLNTPQNVISRYENPDYEGFTLKTLQRLASAFDVALIVKFATFGELDRLTKGRSQQNLAIASYEDEIKQDLSLDTIRSVSTDAQFVSGQDVSSNVVAIFDPRNIQTHTETYEKSTTHHREQANDYR